MRAEVESKEEGLEEEEEEEVGTREGRGASVARSQPCNSSQAGFHFLEHESTKGRPCYALIFPGSSPTQLRQRLRRRLASQEAQFNRTHATTFLLFFFEEIPYRS